MSGDQEELEAQLEKLEQEERDVSALRKKIHDRLSSFPNEQVMQQERELSKRRRELHQEIDELRIKIRMGRG
jgi:hypothetical protein